MKLAVVNAFYPPDPAITGVSASILVEYIRKALPGLEVTVFATDRCYLGGAPPATPDRHVERISASYRGAFRLLRLAGSIWDGLRLARRACRYADLVIAMTDPPLLGLWVGMESRRRHRQWVEWTMDLYPEAFAAAGLISRSSRIYRLILQAMRRFRPAHYICLGPLQHRCIQAHRETSRPAFLLPCGVLSIGPSEVPAWRRDRRIILAYAGNVGEAHSCDVIAEIVRRADPGRFAFVLAASGLKSGRLKSLTRDCPNVTWRAHLPPWELAHADVHIVSLQGRWKHVCVPSKAVAAVCLGRPILFAGSPDTDTWDQFEPAGWLIAEQPDGSYRAVDVDRSLEAIGSPQERARKAHQAAMRGAQLRIAEQDELRRIVDWLAAHILTPASPLQPDSDPADQTVVGQECHANARSTQ